MSSKILCDINKFLEFINEYKEISEVSEISFNIGRILNLLNSQRFHDCDVLCNQIVNSTDFENVKIRPVDKRNMSVIQRIKSNAFYLIERLTRLAFNKILKHELGKEIDEENKLLSTIYDLLKLDIKNKKGRNIMIKVCVYARYSSDSQTEQSIDGQLRVCKEFCERNGYTVVKEYIDRAMTGTNDKRPALQQMLADSKKKEFQFVIVYKLDRFSRSRYDSAVNRAILLKNGVKLVSATENISDAPEGIILDSVLVGLAEYYSVELSQKVKRGLKESRIKGNFTGDRTPYGYDVNNLKIQSTKRKRILLDLCLMNI